MHNLRTEIAGMDLWSEGVPWSLIQSWNLGSSFFIYCIRSSMTFNCKDTLKFSQAVILYSWYNNRSSSLSSPNYIRRSHLRGSFLANPYHFPSDPIPIGWLEIHCDFSLQESWSGAGVVPRHRSNLQPTY